MCGIAGFVGPGDLGVLQAMSDSLIHRGPDGAGYYVDHAIGLHLAHRRLAILDIAGGKQPMWNEDGQVGIVFNGEIYNHEELRRELIAAGHVFRSHHSDTEVLVHGYEQWGVNLPIRLNGMFAFALYDKRLQRLFCARDRFGKKPFYYAADPDFLAFSSELKALLNHPKVSRTVDREALCKYFAYGFIPAPNAFYRGVKKLPGGCCMTYDISTKKAKVECYWSFRIETTDTVPRDAERIWAEELRGLLAQAVKRRLSSDVPLGIFLSGGIDSSAILAFAARAMPAGHPDTYSIGFQESSFDESAYARQVAGAFGSRHHHEILDLDKARHLVPHVLSKLDEPMADSSIIPTYLLCSFARQGVTVALGGDGGDELFAGYDPFKALNIARWYQHFTPGWAHRGLRALVEMLPCSERNMSLEFKLKRALRGVSYPQALWNPVWLGALEPGEIGELLRTPVHFEEVYSEAIAAWENTTADNLMDKTLEFYSRFYLQDDILTKVDRASMMVSLEVRTPFLDNDLVEFARRLPHRYKFRQGTTKYLLKKALEPVLPKNILYRDKKGFGVPLARWLRTWQTPKLESAGLGIETEILERKWSAHRLRRSDHRLFMWSCLALEGHFDRGPI